MKLFLLVTLFSFKTFALSSDAVCVFDHKDYDPPQFSIPHHEGFHTKGHFGCEYICSCKGKATRVMHILDEDHFDPSTKDGTGGPKRAKWFICPFSVQADSWKPIYSTGEDALLYGAKIIAYQPEIDYAPHPAAMYFTPSGPKDVNSVQIKNWAEKNCN